MGSEKCFISIDLHSGYWQCHIADKDIPKTAFLMRYGLYKWAVIPMGLMNAPAMFIQTMNNLFSNIFNFGTTVFLDDILIYSHTVEEHFTLLEKVLVYLCQYTFYYKLKKFSFLCNSTIFLGFDIIPEGMCISNSRYKAWMNGLYLLQLNKYSHS